LMLDFKSAPAVSAVLNASWELRTVLNENRKETDQFGHVGSSQS
jgi:hypothetical protein